MPLGLTRKEQWALIATIGVIVGALAIQFARQPDAADFVHAEGQGIWQRVSRIDATQTGNAAATSANRPAVPIPTLAPAADTPPDAAIDLNAATAEDWERLPGIGPAKAAAIVETRARLGGFQSVDQLTEVRGIGPALLEKLRPYIRTNGAAETPPAGIVQREPGARPDRAAMTGHPRRTGAGRVRRTRHWRSNAERKCRRRRRRPPSAAHPTDLDCRPMEFQR
jgi:competence protein ComEA